MLSAAKSILKINYQENDTSAIVKAFCCHIKQFAYPYLGMPLSDTRLSMVDLQPALDKLAGKAK
jgi:hypothetical protein